MADWLGKEGVEQVAMESTGVYWKPVWNLLEDRFAVMVVNAKHIKQVPGRKTDILDCQCIAAEIGTDMNRFPSDGHIASWAGMCPGNRESAGKRKSGKTTEGSRWLKAVLSQTAWAATRTKGTYRIQPVPPHGRSPGQETSSRRNRTRPARVGLSHAPGWCGVSGLWRGPLRQASHPSPGPLSCRPSRAHWTPSNTSCPQWR